MSKYLEALDKFSIWSGYLMILNEGKYQEIKEYVMTLKELVDEKTEFESRKDYLIEGSKWECVAECLSERFTKETSYTRLENVKDQVLITKIGLSYINYRLPQIERLLEYSMPTQQFLLCFRPIIKKESE